MNKKKVYFIILIIVAISVVVEILLAHPHHHMLWNVIPAADLVIGFAGAWALIFVAKIVMVKVLQRPEDYYDKAGDIDE